MLKTFTETVEFLRAGHFFERRSFFLKRSSWTYGTEFEAIEELEVDLPSSFSWQLHYMEMPYEDALEEYYALFEGHINPEFSAQTDVLQLLRTKGVKVFVPNNWEGIN